MAMVDLNCDLGESFGAYSIGMDEQVVPAVSSVNVACGWHAGDPDVMAATVEMAKAAGVAVGAHPGYPDLMGFGRRDMDLTPREVTHAVQYQIGALQAFGAAAGVKLQHVKPHGALYNRAAVDRDLCRALCRGIAAVDKDLIVLGLANSVLLEEAAAAGLRAASEVFADRAYRDDGTLLPRREAGAVIHDTGEAIRRTVRMVTAGVVTTVSGRDIAIRADSVCVHGDNPRALEFVRSIRDALAAAGVAVAPLGAVVA